MNWTRLILILVSLAIAAYFTIMLYNWSSEYKDLFSYLGDWRSYVAAFALIYAVTGIIKWLLMEEVRITRPRTRRR